MATTILAAIVAEFGDYSLQCAETCAPSTTRLTSKCSERT